MNSRWVPLAVLVLVHAPGAAWSGPADTPRTIRFGAIQTAWTASKLEASIARGVLTLRAGRDVAGVLESAALPVRPLGLYELHLTTRRGPGTRVEVRLLQELRDQQPFMRRLTLHLPGVMRPRSWPLSPYRQAYVTSFAALPAMTRARLQVRVTGGPIERLNYLELHAIQLTHRGQVVLGESVGPNRLLYPDVRGREGDPLPTAWGRWMAHPDAQTRLSTQSPHSKPLCVSVRSGKRWVYLVLPMASVRHGRAYRLSVWVRGTGWIGLNAHPLAERGRAVRVGDPQGRRQKVQTDRWQRVEVLWFADTPHAGRTRPFLTVNGSVDLDDVAFQEVLVPGATP